MTVLNGIDRYHLVISAIDLLPQSGNRGTDLQRKLEEKLIEHKAYINEHGKDLPEIRNWQWNTSRG